MAGSRAASERPRPFGLPVLRADERFVEALAETVAEQVADRLRGRAAETEGYLNPEAAGRYISRLAQAHPRTDQRRPAGAGRLRRAHAAVSAPDA